MKPNPLTIALILPLLLTACGSDAGPAATPGAAAVIVPAPLPDGKPALEIAAETKLADVKPGEFPGLHNVFALSENIISGSEPHGEEALKKISEMGVKTILSVDGKVPDQKTAAKYGMRYVHVPIHYSGISASEMLRIAKTFRETEGPFYVHCFHGKHRGPAAAAVGRIVLDGAPRERALAEMNQWCGTSKKYEGLYETVARAEAPTEFETKSLSWEFPAAHEFKGFRQGMIEVSRVHDNLKSLSKNGWKPTAEHPDADAANEATKLAELFAQSHGLPAVAKKPEDFRGWIGESVEHSRALAGGLGRLAGGEAAAAVAANASFRAVNQRCDACHAVYRNQ